MTLYTDSLDPKNYTTFKYCHPDVLVAFSEKTKDIKLKEKNKLSNCDKK